MRHNQIINLYSILFPTKIYNLMYGNLHYVISYQISSQLIIWSVFCQTAQMRSESGHYKRYSILVKNIDRND